MNKILLTAALVVSTLSFASTPRIDKLPSGTPAPLKKVEKNFVSIPDQLLNKLDDILANYRKDGSTAKLNKVMFAVKNHQTMAVAIFTLDGAEMAYIFIYEEGEWGVYPDFFLDYAEIKKLGLD